MHIESLALHTDLYQLTMAYGYWKSQLHERQAVFHYLYRTNPFKGGYAISCGLEQLVHFIQKFKFASSDLDYLSSLKDDKGSNLFEPAFIDYLSSFSFDFSLDAVDEGTVVFANEPLIRVQGPMIACQLLETPLLNLMNFPTLIATKASRLRHAAGSDTLLEFGLRRAQGVDGGLSASRAAVVGGCDATSNVLAGKEYNLPVKGTHAHSWVMLFDNEKEAFQTYADAMPGNIVFLIDTFDTMQGLDHVISLMKEDPNLNVKAIRLDSGDLAQLSIACRKRLDKEGFKDVKIVASNSLNEYVIEALKEQKAAIDIWGVGTNLATAQDQPALDGVYKLSAVQDENGQWVDKVKLSNQPSKVSLPGIPGVRRFYDKEGKAVGDLIYDIRHSKNKVGISISDYTQQISFEHFDHSEDLLKPVFTNGECVYSHPSVNQIKMHVDQSSCTMPEPLKRFLNPHLYNLAVEESLCQTKYQLIEKLRSSLRECS